MYTFGEIGRGKVGQKGSHLVVSFWQENISPSQNLWLIEK